MSKRKAGEEPRILGIIPSRYASTRFPAKPLKLIAGKPMVYHTYTNAKACKTLTKLVVATDHEEIKAAVEGFGGDVVMTDPSCDNGTERCLEVMNKLKAEGEEFDIIVNIQGDEPFIEAHHIEVAAQVVLESEAVMGTLARPHIDKADVESVHNVKVVLDVNNYALYFSRAIIPHNKKGEYDPDTPYWRKLGIYSYTADFLPKFIKMPVSKLQKAEDLEQNKVIEAGHKIKVGIVEDAVHGVDTESQLVELNELIENGTFPHMDLPSLAHLKA